MGPEWEDSRRASVPARRRHRSPQAPQRKEAIRHLAPRPGGTSSRPPGRPRAPMRREPFRGSEFRPGGDRHGLEMHRLRRPRTRTRHKLVPRLRLDVVAADRRQRPHRRGLGGAGQDDPRGDRGGARRPALRLHRSRHLCRHGLRWRTLVFPRQRLAGERRHRRLPRRHPSRLVLQRAPPRRRGRPSHVSVGMDTRGRPARPRHRPRRPAAARYPGAGPRRHRPIPSPHRRP